MNPRVPFSELFGSKLDGRTNADLAAFFGVSLPTIAHWKERGVPACKVPSLPRIKRPYPAREIDRSAMWRNYAMSCEYKQGKTLEQIGQEYGISRERVRQIISKDGLTAADGGKAMRAFARKSAKHREKDPSWFDTSALKIYGVTSDELKELNGGMGRSVQGSPAQRYMSQRNNANKRGIGWELTFREWLAVWQESGHFHERGRGQGYCMTRIGDTGPYAVGNVEIKTVGQNFSESYYKHPWHERFSGLPTHSKQTHCKRGHPRSPETCSPCGNCRICAAITYANRKIAKLEAA